MPQIRKRTPAHRRESMKHQARAIRENCKRRHPAWFMEMRTGKTLSCIRWIQEHLSDVRTVLVLAPVTVLEAWERELWLEGERYLTAYGFTTKQRERAILNVWESKTRRFLLMNYEAALAMGEAYIYKGKRRRRVPLIAKLPWDVVVLDESTVIKNPLAQITRICLDGFRDARHRTILTGLPNPESDLDMVAQFLFLDGRFMEFTNFWTARAALFTKVDEWTWTPNPGTKAKIRRWVHNRAFVLTAAEAGMPSRFVREMRQVEMNAAQRKLYYEVLENFSWSSDALTTETDYVITQRLWLQQIAGGFDPDGNLISSNMADELLYLLGSELARRKVVVWFRFRHELEYVRERLNKAGIGCVSVMGGEDRTFRKRKLSIFRETKTPVLLAMEKCAKFGIDCSVADVAVYYSNEWSNEDRSQSEKRIVHPKKRRSHLIIDLASKKTVAVHAARRVLEKGLESKLFMRSLTVDLLEDWKRYAAAHKKKNQQETGASRAGARSGLPGNELPRLRRRQYGTVKNPARK